MDLTEIAGLGARASDELRAAGRAHRQRLPRSAHAEHRPHPGRDPLGIIERQNADRLPDLVPLRMHRMRQSPFAFYRGTAAIQAADFASGVATGAAVVSSGDAHLSNFGFYRSPQRSLVFDLNDFDEAAIAPWEWDVKRLVASVALAALARGVGRAEAERAARLAAGQYRHGIRELDRIPTIECYFRSIDLDGGAKVPKSLGGVVDAARRASKRRTSARVIERTTVQGPDGRRRFVEDPPLLVHAEQEVHGQVAELWDQYLQTTRADVALMLSHYRVDDIARRVVGVGSVGTRCYIIALSGPDGEPLVLQVKEAGEAVAYEYGGMPGQAMPGAREEYALAQPGYRVVSGQRILQAVSDPFLGYIHGRDRAYYVRQFRDGNSSVEVEVLDERAFRWYGRACALALARAHAQSPALPYIAGYLGRGEAFDAAVAAWGLAYADQAVADHAAFEAALAAGRFPAS